MSETLDIETETPTRRPRGERPAREVRREAAPPETTIEGADGALTPEAALAEAQQQIQQQDRATADARRAAREAEQRAQAAERRASQAEGARATDQQTTVAAAIEASAAEMSAAEAQIITARESGDVRAEIAAQKVLASATYRHSHASGQLEWLKSQPKATVPQAPDQPSDAARKWLDEHPAFHTDEAYRSTAEGAHNSAIRAGKAAGSPQYIAHIESIMTRVYGEGHGQDGTKPQERQTPVADRPVRGDAAPPSRGTSGHSGGYKAVRTPAGDMMVQRKSNGGMSIRFSSPDQEAQFREYAELSKMTLAEYARDMIEAGEEAARGEDNGLKMGDGGTYR